jgi:ribulose-5-phosphate 4-epimerase/fuculose-1-phosphate aldolase
MTPTVGRIVHFHAPSGTFPAIVVRVINPVCLNLQVFCDDSATQLHYVQKVGEGLDIGCWSWPPKA